jgi:site-specific recombinase XerD
MPRLTSRKKPPARAVAAKVNKKRVAGSTPRPSARSPRRRRRAWSVESIKFLTQDEMRKLLGVIDSPRDYAMFLLAYRHGLRASEIGLLRVDDIDLKQQRIMIHRLKGSLSGYYPLQPDTIKALKRAVKARNVDSPTLFLSRRSEPISRRSIDDLMKAYGEKAGLPEHKRHFHCLKHSIATHMLDAGADLRLVQDWLGHARVQNTVIYAQISNRRRDDEARKVFLSGKIV